MTEAVTYGDLQLQLGATSLSVYRLAIIEEPGGHGRMSVDAETQEGAKDYLLYEEYGSVALYADVGETLQPLFYGIVTRMEVAARGGRCEISLEAVTQSYMMDLAARNCSFQDTAMTTHQLIKGIMASYPGSQALILVPDEAIGHIAIQYQETDWEFIKRVLSGYGAAICVDSTMPGICLTWGLEMNWRRQTGTSCRTRSCVILRRRMCTKNEKDRCAIPLRQMTSLRWEKKCSFTGRSCTLERSAGISDRESWSINTHCISRKGL